MSGCGGSDTTDAKPKAQKAPKDTRSISEREADYQAALPDDLTSQFSRTGLNDVGYQVCAKHRDGASEGEILNTMKSADPIWMGLYGKDVYKAALKNLC